MKHGFSDYHPAVNFTYFTLVILCAMFFMNPACLTISAVCSFAYAARLNGGKKAWLYLLYMLPLLAAAALLNPAFNHEGATILAYLPGGNPLTLESILYGAAAALMMGTVILWFSCYHAVMTSDKFIYLFGRVIPGLSLILSMTLRFVPRFREQLKVISNSQKCVGRDASSGGVIRRAKNGLTILSIMITWSLENAVDTADSMKSRGYGLPGRTAFSIFRMDSRDQRALAAIGALGLYTLAGGGAGAFYYRYFPSVRGAAATPYVMSVFCAYLLLCLMPLIIEFWEDRRWKAIR